MMWSVLTSSPMTLLSASGHVLRSVYVTLVKNKQIHFWCGYMTYLT